MDKPAGICQQYKFIEPNAIMDKIWVNCISI